MLLSRGVSILKMSRFLKQGKPTNLQVLRNSHDVNYRSPAPPAPAFIYTIAEVVQGFAYWWILWHLWTEPGHVFGEFEYPNPRKYTDEELGIPPID